MSFDHQLLLQPLKLQEMLVSLRECKLNPKALMQQNRGNMTFCDGQMLREAERMINICISEPHVVFVYDKYDQSNNRNCCCMQHYVSLHTAYNQNEIKSRKLSPLFVTGHWNGPTAIWENTLLSISINSSTVIVTGIFPLLILWQFSILAHYNWIQRNRLE